MAFTARAGAGQAERRNKRTSCSKLEHEALCHLFLNILRAGSTFGMQREGVE